LRGATERDEKFTRYLLGDLPEEERLRLEEEYFADDAAFENLAAVRDELTDLHARGELEGRERELFERHFLSTGPRRQRAREAKELIEFSTRVAASATAERARGFSWWPPVLAARTPQLRFAFAALLLCVALGGAWLLVRRAGTRPEERAAVTPSPTVEVVSQAQPGGGAQARPEGHRPDGGAATPPPPGSRPDPRREGAPGKAANRAPVPTPAAPSRGAAHVASLLLTPVLTRDAGRSNTLHLRPETTTARLQLPFKGGDYRRYVVVLRTVDGERVWRGAAAGARTPGAGNTAVVNVPARVFRRQDHTATLYGVTPGGASHEISEYSFTVIKGGSR
jgi:hypothetical protein